MLQLLWWHPVFFHIFHFYNIKIKYNTVDKKTKKQLFTKILYFFIMSSVLFMYSFEQSINTVYCPLDSTVREQRLFAFALVRLRGCIRWCRHERRTGLYLDCSPQTPRTCQHQTTLHFWLSRLCLCLQRQIITWKTIAAQLYNH